MSSQQSFHQVPCSLLHGFLSCGQQGKAGAEEGWGEDGAKAQKVDGAGHQRGRKPCLRPRPFILPPVPGGQCLYSLGAGPWGPTNLF